MEGNPGTAQKLTIYGQYALIVPQRPTFFYIIIPSTCTSIMRTQSQQSQGWSPLAPMSLFNLSHKTQRQTLMSVTTHNWTMQASQGRVMMIQKVKQKMSHPKLGHLIVFPMQVLDVSNNGLIIHMGWHYIDDLFITGAFTKAVETRLGCKQKVVTAEENTAGACVITPQPRLRSRLVRCWNVHMKVVRQAGYVLFVCPLYPLSYLQTSSIWNV